MIGIRDTLTLAYTKLRTRKVRLIITVVVSGLLFTGLAGASMVVRGVFASVESFNKEHFGSRYIISAIGQGSFSAYTDPTLIARANDIYKATIAEKKAEAKKLDIEFDSATERSPIVEYDSPKGKEKSLDMTTPAALQAFQEYMAQHPDPGMPELKTSASKFGATSYYESKTIPVLEGAKLQVLKDGKETFTETSTQNMYSPSGLNSFIMSWSQMSKELMQPFVLPGQNTDASADGAIPIVVPYDAAEQLLGMTELPVTAKSADKLARLKEVRSKAPSVTFSVCYRNTTSNSLVNQAIQTQQEIEQNKSNKNYQKPELIYGLPSTPCGSVPVVRDVRTADTKALAAKQEKFDRTFGKPDAQQTTLTFRIVGISPTISNGAAFGIGQFVSSMVTSSLGSGWYTPVEYSATNPLLAELFKPKAGFGQLPMYYAEFSNAQQAHDFVEKNDCKPDYMTMNPYTGCVTAGKYFTLAPFGSNSLALDSALRIFNKVFSIAALVIAAIGAVIMMGTVGRIIADSRRETAVFRAIGAKRLDIAQIYITYTIFLALLICLFALTVGMAGAAFVQHRYGAEATVHALVAYNAQDLTRSFGLMTVYPADMLRLLGLAVAGSLLSTVLPLLRNLRRNPIRDMRDEN